MLFTVVPGHGNLRSFSNIPSVLSAARGFEKYVHVLAIAANVAASTTY